MRCAKSLCAATLAAGILWNGCSDSDPLGREAVTGTVTLSGNPVQSGSIEFHPVGETGIMSGATIVDGTYAVDEAKGLPPGDYIVRIFASDGKEVEEEVPGESRMVAKQLIPPEYNARSSQQRTVVAGAKNVFDFEIPASTQ